MRKKIYATPQRRATLCIPSLASLISHSERNDGEEEEEEEKNPARITKTKEDEAAFDGEDLCVCESRMMH